ncbi:MAG: hypothetical protein IPI49_18365 [Myxococcales bacterium]|nr:hypothetical protein [Myxococcales bacterium]
MCPPYADPGYLASAHFAKARLFADSDPTAAKDLLQRAITAWQPDAGMWKRELGEAQALLAKLSR